MRAIPRAYLSSAPPRNQKTNQRAGRGGHTERQLQKLRIVQRDFRVRPQPEHSEAAPECDDVLHCGFHAPRSEHPPPPAPISFKSPAPNARSNTSGNSSASAKNIPSTEFAAPRHPPVRACNATPKTMPDIVSQFGIARLRRSTKPATNEKASADTQI